MFINIITLIVNLPCYNVLFIIFYIILLQNCNLYFFFFLHYICAVKVKLHCVKPNFKNLKRELLVINFVLKLNENISMSNYLNTCEQFIIFIIAL